MSKPTVSSLEDVSAELTKQPNVNTQVVNPGLDEEEWAFLQSIDEKHEDKIYHKVDRRLIPLLAVLYLLAQLDRSNIANAKIEGLEDSLDMTGTDYNVALSIFMVPYIIAEVPSNYLLARFDRPSHYIGGLVIVWGTVMTLTGVVQNFGGLLAARFMLGLTEAGFYPGAIAVIGVWYPPNKTQMRTAMLFCSAAVSGAFSGLLAAGIAQMSGIGGYEGWRWIFLIEGIATVAIGIITFTFLPDSPSRSKWLTPDERRFLELKHKITRGRSSEEKEKFKWKTLWSVVRDWQIYLQALVFWSFSIPGFGLKFMMPQLIKNMGFRSTTAQLLSAPPYACAAISALTSAYIADRYSWRMPIIVVGQVLVIIANAIQFVFADDLANNIPACYFSVFLCLIGVYPIIPGTTAWTLNNLAGPQRRSLGIAMMLTIGNVGAVIGSYIFLEAEAPKYPTGFGMSFGVAALGLICALGLEFTYWTINKRNALVTEDEVREKYTEDQLNEMGDKSPLFRYTL